MVGLPANRMDGGFGEQLNLPLTGSATTNVKIRRCVLFKSNSVTKMNIPSEPISKT